MNLYIEMRNKSLSNLEEDFTPKKKGLFLKVRAGRNKTKK